MVLNTALLAPLCSAAIEIWTAVRGWTTHWGRNDTLKMKQLGAIKSEWSTCNSHHHFLLDGICHRCVIVLLLKSRITFFIAYISSIELLQTGIPPILIILFCVCYAGEHPSHSSSLGLFCSSPLQAALHWHRIDRLRGAHTLALECEDWMIECSIWSGFLNKMDGSDRNDPWGANWFPGTET